MNFTRVGRITGEFCPLDKISSLEYNKNRFTQKRGKSVLIAIYMKPITARAYVHSLFHVVLARGTSACLILATIMVCASVRDVTVSDVKI